MTRKGTLRQLLRSYFNFKNHTIVFCGEAAKDEIISSSADEDFTLAGEEILTSLYEANLMRVYMNSSTGDSIKR